MRRSKLAVLTMLLCLLCACGGKETDTLSGPMALRQALLTSESVTADLDVTLPDEDAVWQFSMHAVLTPEGSMDSEITAPESVSGIRAKADDLGRQLAFDGAMVDFGVSPGGLESPVLLPALLMRAWCAGDLLSAGMDGDDLLAVYRLDYGAEEKQVRTWLDGDQIPIRAEIVQNGAVQCTVIIQHFTFGGTNETAQEDLG